MNLLTIIILLLIFFGFIVGLAWLAKREAKDLPKGVSLDKMSRKQLRKYKESRGRYK